MPDAGRAPPCEPLGMNLGQACLLRAAACRTPGWKGLQRPARGEEGVRARGPQQCQRAGRGAKGLATVAPRACLAREGRGKPAAPAAGRAAGAARAQAHNGNVWEGALVRGSMGWGVLTDRGQRRGGWGWGGGGRVLCWRGQRGGRGSCTHSVKVMSVRGRRGRQAAGERQPRHPYEPAGAAPRVGRLVQVGRRRCRRWGCVRRERGCVGGRFLGRGCRWAATASTPVPAGALARVGLLWGGAQQERMQEAARARAHMHAHGPSSGRVVQRAGSAGASARGAKEFRVPYLGPRAGGRGVLAQTLQAGPRPRGGLRAWGPRGQTSGRCLPSLRRCGLGRGRAARRLEGAWELGRSQAPRQGRRGTRGGQCRAVRGGGPAGRRGPAEGAPAAQGPAAGQSPLLGVLWGGRAGRPQGLRAPRCQQVNGSGGGGRVRSTMVQARRGRPPEAAVVASRPASYAVSKPSAAAAARPKPKSAGATARAHATVIRAPPRRAAAGAEAGPRRQARPQAPQRAPGSLAARGSSAHGAPAAPAFSPSRFTFETNR
jgi:hypothetical protein